MLKSNDHNVAQTGQILIEHLSFLRSHIIYIMLKLKENFFFCGILPVLIISKLLFADWNYEVEINIKIFKLSTHWVSLNHYFGYKLLFLELSDLFYFLLNAFSLFTWYFWLKNVFSRKRKRSILPISRENKKTFNWPKGKKMKEQN